VDPHYTQALTHLRSELNERFALSARAESLLSMHAVQRWMRGPLQTLFVALQTQGVVDAHQLVRECFEIALIAGVDPLDGILQQRSGLLEAACASTLPKLAPLLTGEPALLRAFCNALMQPQLNAQRWLALMYQLLNQANVASPEQFKAIGLVAGWRCGMAHYRSAALSYLPQLDDSILGIIFAEETKQFQIDELRTILAASPWLPNHTGALQIRARIGGTSVLNGLFSGLPLVRGDQNQLYVLSQRRMSKDAPHASDFDCYALHIDQFGHVLLAQGAHVCKSALSSELPNSELPAGSFELSPQSLADSSHALGATASILERLVTRADDRVDLRRWGDTRAVVHHGPTWLVCHSLSHAITVLA
jgi:hypothetical protein